MGQLVGRSAELGRMRELLTEAEAGQPVVILVSGDAGVGKTRLVSELADGARQRGFTVLAGRCAELADTVPYLPLADALRGAAAASCDGPLLDALAARPVLARLLPDREITRQPADLPGLAQQQLFGAVLGMLTELAEAQPVLLILEDMHWADRSTRDLVTFLSRVLHTERIALVVTYRTDDMHRAHPLRAVVAELLRLPTAIAVDVGPLDPAAMAEHLTRLSGGRQEAGTLERLIKRAEGNPYYAEELLATSSAFSELPAGLADLLLARTVQLSEHGLRVLHAAAVTGRKVDDELVMRAAGLTPAEYEGAIREAVTRQLLVADGAQGLEFRHALLREAVYNDLLPGERTRLHARLAELLSDERRLAQVPGSAAELAHHCLASHDVPGAFAASVLAGREYDRLAAPADAHRHYDQALSLWERVAEPEKLAGMSRGKLAFRSALSAADGGEVGRAVQQLQGLIGFLADDSDRKLLCRAQERLAYFLPDIDHDEEAIAAASAAVDVLPADPPTWERARALATHARSLLIMPDTGPARARAEEAEAAAMAAGVPWVQADALVTLAGIRERAGRIKDAIATCAKALQLVGDSDMPGVELRASFMMARLQLEWGDLAEAAATAHVGTHRAERAGLSMAPFGLDLRYLHYLAHYSDGDWDHAQEIADQFAVRVASVAEARLSAMALFIDVARGGARVSDRRAWLAPFMAQDIQTEYIGRGLLAEDTYWAGDLEMAAAEAEATVRATAAAWGEEYGPEVFRPAAVGLAALGDQARLARAAGQPDRASEIVERARALMEQARLGMSSPYRSADSIGVDGRGWLARCEAEFARAEGNNDPAGWRAVVDAFAPGFVYELARSRWRLAEALAEAGDRDAAQHEWLLAAAAADQLGAVRLRAALTDLGRRARLAAAPAALPATDRGGAVTLPRSPLAGLTSRELEVLQLLASGQSNREIAAGLFISPKTASVHVSNILAKLGAASRTEAAAIAHGNGIGLLPGPGQPGQSMQPRQQAR
jgi:DNA-binding CsgD family transcriptional regulator